MYRASVNLAKLSLMAVSCSPRPSAASRLSKGMVYPLGFFQLEILGGIFQSCWSLTLTGRGGECMMGTGGDPAPLGTCKRRFPACKTRLHAKIVMNTRWCEEVVINTACFKDSPFIAREQ